MLAANQRSHALTNSCACLNIRSKTSTTAASTFFVAQHLLPPNFIKRSKLYWQDCDRGPDTFRHFKLKCTKATCSKNTKYCDHLTQWQKFPCADNFFYCCDHF